MASPIFQIFPGDLWKGGGGNNILLENFYEMIFYKKRHETNSQISLLHKQALWMAGKERIALIFPRELGTLSLFVCQTKEHMLQKSGNTLLPKVQTLCPTVAQECELRVACVTSHNAPKQPLSSGWTYTSCSAFEIKDQQCECSLEGVFCL